MTFLLACLIAPIAAWRTIVSVSRCSGPETEESCKALSHAAVWSVVALYSILIVVKNWKGM